MDPPDGMSNVRQERPTLLPPFTGMSQQNIASTAPGDMDAQASRALRIQLFLNPPKRDGYSSFRDGPPPFHCGDADSKPATPDSMPARTLPPLTDLPAYRSDAIGSDGAESPKRLLPSALGPAASIESIRPVGRHVTTPQEMYSKAPDYFTPPQLDHLSFPRHSGQTETPPSQIRQSPGLSYTQSTSSPPHYQRHQSPYSDEHTPGDSQSAQPVSMTDQSLASAPGSTAQSSYRLMAMDIDHRTVQVPVDVQAASKMADEKRKRNAGASARFRQRRKEKERETQHTIESLKTKLRKAEDDLRELQMEREYLRLQRDQYFYMLNNRPVYAN